MSLFFIGIKGSGMSALAIMCQDLGYTVSGSDIDKHIFTEDALRERNIPIYPFSETNIQDNMTVVIGNAFNDDFPEVAAAYRNPTVKASRYHDFLGELMKQYFTISVSGSHGKTTTTTLLKDMLAYSKKTGYLIGDGHGELAQDDEYLAVEACEYKRHFLAYYPDIAIITNVELDHVDYFKDDDDYASSYESFAQNVGKYLIICGDDPKARALRITKEHYYYGFSADNDFSLTHVEYSQTHSSFDCSFRGQLIGHFDLPLVGDHMILNALSVIAVGYLLGIPAADIEAGLASFHGAARRFVIEENGDNVYIDDYAHHPTEVKVTLMACRRRFPDRKLVAVFKPHRVSRVKYFAEAFAEALQLADVIALCPFTSIDDAEEGIDIDIHYLEQMIPGSFIVDDNDDDAKRLADEGPAVYAFMSSKDIYDLKNRVKRYQAS